MDNNTINAQEALEAVLYKFLSLHDALKNQQLLLQKQNDEFIKQVSALSEQVKQFQLLEPTVHQQFAATIQAVAKNLGAAIHEETGKTASKSVEQTVQKLQRASEYAQQALETAQTQASSRLWREVLMGIGCSIIASLVAVWLLMPKPVLPINKEQMAIYESGNGFNHLMQKLSKREQQKVWNILERKNKAKSNQQDSALANY